MKLWWFGVVVVGLSGCVDAKAVDCGDYVCPSGNVCIAGGCAVQADVDACTGLADGAQCNTATSGAGTCQSGVCRSGLCGNGVTDLGELCDDGNRVSGDGCRADCGKVEQCGDLIIDPGEACDDNNANPDDGCDACKLTTWAATPLVGSTVAATDVDLFGPQAVAVDSLGRIYYADLNNQTVWRFDPDGNAVRIAGSGTPGFSGDGGPASVARLQFPRAVAIDGLDRVLIADSGNNRIRRVDAFGTITTIAGTGQIGSGGDGGEATGATLYNPQGVAVDGLGQIYISDTQNCVIRRILADGRIGKFAGTYGTCSFIGDGGYASSSQLNMPLGLAIDPVHQVLLVADTGNKRVRKVDLVLPLHIDTVAGGGGSSADNILATASSFDAPTAVAVASNGDVVVADAGNARNNIRRFSIGGNIITIAGTPGGATRAYEGDGGPATAAKLGGPTGVAVDTQGRVVIADAYNQRLRRVDTSGTITTVAGTGAVGHGDTHRAATSLVLQNPMGMTRDSAGRLVIADTGAATIWRIEADGSITRIAGDGRSGFSGDGGQATAAHLSNPIDVVYDSAGRLIICDTNNNRIRRVDTTGVITTIAGTGTSTYNGDGVATSVNLDQPESVAVDSMDRILVADSVHYIVRRIDTAGNLTTIAGTHDAGGDTGDTGPATSAKFTEISGLAVDSTGRIYISDRGANRIRRIDTLGNIDAYAGNGTGGFTGDGGAAKNAEMSLPTGLTFDTGGNLVVATFTAIRRVDGAGNISTLAGGATQGYAGDGGAAAAARLDGGGDVSVGATGIAFTEYDTNHVRNISPTGIVSTIAGAIDPPTPGAVLHARLADPRQLAVTPSLTLVAGGATGTLELLRNGRLDVVAGRYPQVAASGIGNLARFQTFTFGDVGGVAYDEADGKIYISETTADRIDVISLVSAADPSTWTIAPFVTGLRGPTGLYLDTATHELYIADTGHQAIRLISTAGGSLTTVVDAGFQLGFFGDGGPATMAMLNHPAAITKCPNGDLFIADTDNNRVRRLSGGTITTVAGTGVAASAGNGAPATFFPIDHPRGLACNALGNLFVSSTTTVRVLVANDSGVIDGGGAVGTVYGEEPRTTFPASTAICLGGIAVTGPSSLDVSDSCSGLLVQLDRMVQP